MGFLKRHIWVLEVREDSLANDTIYAQRYFLSRRKALRAKEDYENILESFKGIELCLMCKEVQ